MKRLLHPEKSRTVRGGQGLESPAGRHRARSEATEATVKRLSDERRLAIYRVLHFATHDTLSGEISGTREPGLILTPSTRPDLFLLCLSCVGSFTDRRSRGQCRFRDLGINLANRALEVARRSISSTLHLASIASITASQTSFGRTSFCVMSSKLTQ